MVKYAIASLMFSLALAAPLFSMPLDTKGLKACGTVTGQTALGGARFQTTGDTVVKLALVKAPELWPDGSPYKSWPHAQASRKALDGQIGGKELVLFCEGKTLNRNGETVAHVIADGKWLQASLVEAGQVFVFPAPIRKHGIDALFDLEDTARSNQRGLWAFDNLRPVSATGDDTRPGWFQIVRGQILSAQSVGNTTYLNFGEDWRTDFTIEVPAAAARRFLKAGHAVDTFGGRMIEARGWLDYKAGPRLVILGPGQLRFTVAGQ